MAKDKEVYKTISARSQSLLKCQENGNVDFKKTVKSLDPEDIVAFANSESGGAILLGVKEEKNGRMVTGKIVGCPIDDGAFMSILDKANSCSSPIYVKIIIENLNSKPFLRVEIPSSNHKPHCTKIGIYKIRNGGRNEPLVPPLMLQMHLDDQRDQFLKRFKEATQSLTEEFMVIKKAIVTEINDLSDSLSYIDSKVEQIQEDSGCAAVAADESLNHAEQAASNTEGITDEVQELNTGINSMQADVSLLLHGLLTPEKKKEASVKRKLHFLVKNEVFVKRRDFIAYLMEIGPYTKKQILAWEKELKEQTF